MSDKPTASTKPEPVIWEPGDIDYESEPYYNSKLARFLIIVAIAAAGYFAYQPIKWLLVDWDQSGVNLWPKLMASRTVVSSGCHQPTINFGKHE